jgi:cyclopropane fatty-acyl-phospholipid synthase-like methyltransferase
MRTAEDFNAYYKTPDPWRIGHANRRDKALSGAIARHVEGKTVLELGCGEGHLSATVFGGAKRIHGVDISPLAVARATALNIRNASFETADFLSVSFAGYDVIAAIECLYYLSSDEQDAFFRKLVSEHKGEFILSAPIIGSNEYRNYYTHTGLLSTFARYGLTVVEWQNLNAYRKAGLGGTLAAVAARLSDGVLAYCPERFIYQRCYVLRVG